MDQACSKEAIEHTELVWKREKGKRGRAINIARGRTGRNRHSKKLSDKAKPREFLRQGKSEDASFSKK